MILIHNNGNEQKFSWYGFKSEKNRKSRIKLALEGNKISKSAAEHFMAYFSSVAEGATHFGMNDENQGGALEFSQKGIALLQMGRYDEAISYCEKALEIDPNSKVDLNNKTMALAGLGKYEDALVCCNKVLDLDPPNRVALNNKGATLASLKRYEEALSCFDKVLSIDPNDSSAVENKKRLLERMKK